jgi:tetratricopeptide (TPR) repeat protein
MDPAYFRIFPLLDSGRHQEAEVLLRKILAGNPEEGKAWQLLGRALLGQQKLVAAEEAARKTIALEPESDNGYYLLATILLEREQDKAALHAATEAIRLNPEDSLNYALAARVLNSLSRYPEAAAMAEAGLTQDDSCDSCLFHLGQARLLSGDHGASDEATRLLLKDNPEDAGNHSARGYHLLVAGDPGEAQKHFFKALRLDPMNRDARYGLSQALSARNPLLRLALKGSLLFDRWGLKAILGGVAILWLVSNLPKWTKDIPGAGTLLVGCRSLCTYLPLAYRKTRWVVTADERRAACWCLPFFAMQGYVIFNWFQGGVVTGSLTRFPDHLFAWVLLPSLVWEIYDSRMPPVRWKLAGLSVICTLLMIIITLDQRRQAEAFVQTMTAISKELPKPDKAQIAERMASALKPMIQHRQRWKMAELAILIICAFSSNIRHFLEGRTADPD